MAPANNSRVLMTSLDIRAPPQLAARSAAGLLATLHSPPRSWAFAHAAALILATLAKSTPRAKASYWSCFETNGYILPANGLSRVFGRA
jgi:hypothetical protein